MSSGKANRTNNFALHIRTLTATAISMYLTAPTVTLKMESETYAENLKQIMHMTVVSSDFNNGIVGNSVLFPQKAFWCIRRNFLRFHYVLKQLHYSNSRTSMRR